MNNQPENQEENNKLYEHFYFVVDKGQGFLRIDKFLFHKIENVSRNKIQNAARAGNILVNSFPVKPSYKVKPSDEISIVLPHPPREVEIIPQHIPIDIVYEDKDIIIVNKEAGMVVHPGYANYSGTLLNALYFHLKDKNMSDEPVYLIHRIDKDTSGLVIAAKNEVAQSNLAHQFYYHTIERKYIALVWGDPDNDTGTIEGHIGRDPKDRKRMAVFTDGEKGKEAITHYKVIKRYGYVTLVECQLETGRTHQIRAHFKYINHPLFNDTAYGGNKILKGTTFAKYKQFIQNCFKLINRQALHAKSLGFEHPTTKKHMLFESELPDDFEAVLKKWELYIKEK